MTILRTLVIFFAVLSIAVIDTAHAANNKETINLAGKQRMLTQKMSKEAILVALDINKAENLANLKSTHDLFDKTLKGLKDGDADLGLEATKKPKIKKQLGVVSGLWDEFKPSIQGIISSGSATKEQIADIASKNLKLLKEMNKAVKFYEANAAGEGTNPALAKAINLSGRQRMLTQKMSKEFLLVAYGNDADANKKNLSETVSLFDTTLNGLINGDSGVGLSAAPNDAIKAQLDKVSGLWAPFKGAIESGDKDAVAKNNVRLLKEMNKAVQLFEKL